METSTVLLLEFTLLLLFKSDVGSNDQLRVFSYPILKATMDGRQTASHTDKADAGKSGFHWFHKYRTQNIMLFCGTAGSVFSLPFNWAGDSAFSNTSQVQHGSERLLAIEMLNQFDTLTINKWNLPFELNHKISLVLREFQRLYVSIKSSIG